MRKKIILLCFMIMAIVSGNSHIYGADEYKYCTDKNYANFEHGCKEWYVGITGSTTKCTADDFATGKYGCKDKYLVGDWWGAAGSFFNGAAAKSTEALNDLTNLVKVVGNMIFVAATVILGVKYIWGGVDAKASVKDSLITLVVAALFFYGYTTISNLFITGNKLVFINTGSYETTAKAIYSTILYVCNFLAIGGLVYIGVRYMMAGAEGKASLKARGVPIVLGVIMVYATITFLNFIVGIL